MPVYFVSDGTTIINAINADSKEDAELLTNKECFLNDESFNYGVGATFDGTTWHSPFSPVE